MMVESIMQCAYVEGRRSRSEFLLRSDFPDG